MHIKKPAFVVQYDLLAGSPAAIIASMDTIGISTANFIAALQTGSDGRIYLVKTGDSTLACITNPNQPGNSCSYIDNVTSLSATGNTGLPSFLTSFFCNIPSNLNTITQGQSISIYPIPFSNELQLLFK